MRAPVVFYNRCNEAAAQLKPGDFDWDEIFAGGVRWFHSGGIFAALSETTGELIIEGMKAAKAAGAVTSFDLNYRAKLWNLWGGARGARSKVVRRIVEHVDVLVGNEEDLQMGLGIPGPEVARQVQARPERLLRHDRQSRRDVPERQDRGDHAARGALDQPAQLGRGGLDRRQDVRVAHLPSWTCSTASAAATACGGLLLRPAVRRASEQEAVNLGWAHGALLTTFPGDTTMATLEQVQAFAKGGSARIQR